MWNQSCLFCKPNILMAGYYISLLDMIVSHSLCLDLITNDAVPMSNTNHIHMHFLTHTTVMEGGTTWPPPTYLAPLQVRITNVRGDGNCLFYCLLRSDQKVTHVASMRRKMMEELHRVHRQKHDHLPYTWYELTMYEINDRNNSRHWGGWRHCHTFREYRNNMLDATPGRALWGGNHEAMLYARQNEKNVAVYQQEQGRYRLLVHYNYGKGSADDGHLLLLTNGHYQMLNMVIYKNNFISSSKISSMGLPFGWDPKTFQQRFDVNINRLESEIEFLIQNHVLLDNKCFTWSSLLELAGRHSACLSQSF